MTVTIQLKPEIERRLAEKAKQNGLPMETFIEVFIEDSLEEKTKDNFSPPEKLTKEEWREEFKKWTDSHKGKNYPTISDEDLRRENMYEDRF